MKALAGFFAMAVAGGALAHEGHEHAPIGKPLTVAVKTGEGVNTYETVPGWGALPEGKQIGPTHGGVAVDKAGNIYVATSAEHSICVFKPDGTFLKSIAKDNTALHSLSIVEQGGKEFIFGAIPGTQKVVKLNLDGSVAMQIPNEGTGDIPQGLKGVTSVAAGPDGSLYVACGYGSNLLHKFDATGKLLKSVGGRGKEDGKFVTCHGVAIDSRGDGEPLLLVADRENRRLVHLDLEMEFKGVHAEGLRRPCAVSFHGDHCAVAELEARVAILGADGSLLTVLGDNPNRKQWANFKVPAADMSEGIFTAPHGLSYDAEGNLYVQDWNATGRVTKLVKTTSN